MMSSTASSLISFVSSTLSEDRVSGNIHVVYSLVHRAHDVLGNVRGTDSEGGYAGGGRIRAVVTAAEEALGGGRGGEGNNWTADDVLDILKRNMWNIKNAIRREIAETVTGADVVKGEEEEVVYNYEEEVRR